MKKLLLTLLLGSGSLGAAYATNYYVAPTGTNTTTNSTGLSAGRPFQTIQYAANLTNPGDTVFVRSGTYSNTSPGGTVFTVRRSGTPTAWIVYRNYPGERPLLQFNSWNSISLLDGVSYIEINGFRIQGNNRNVVLANATAQPGGCATNGVGTPDPQFNGNGINIDGRTGNSTGHPHHLRIVNNEVFECGGSGISAIQSDYVTIENNLVYNNSWYTIYGTSGISILSSWNFDASTGYRTIVRNNRCFGNRLFVPWYNRFATTPCQGITDGNGIIVDTNTDLLYTGRTLVANNLVVNNGGAGVQCFQSNHIDVINNTAYHNSQSVEITGGEIYANRTDDAVFQNNILVADATNVLTTANRNTNVTRTNNLYFGGNGSANAIAVPGTNAVRADPQFVNPTTDWATADFRLRSTSAAINAGLLNTLVPPVDLTGSPRVVSSAPDLGAYEYNSTLTATAAAKRLVALEAYPNPFGSRATLRYVTTRAGKVRLEVLDNLGRRVALLVDGEQPAGPHEVAFDAPSHATGLYYARLTTPTSSEIRTLSRGQ
ncbi:right-handed parallel beta-helix repeat-containing protein [Hymenobacter terrenus]|uniref:right-handed parallel beta-helix repeat-containing protein n=1 Tax=Hymenobacter terrenus TaxID=1629124 RepID=UPI0006978EEB|nr:right-handed parallel beta-helix repeat-containing protein [Hymenobacter terrenus]